MKGKDCKESWQEGTNLTFDRGISSFRFVFIIIKDIQVCQGHKFQSTRAYFDRFKEFDNYICERIAIYSDSMPMAQNAII